MATVNKKKGQMAEINIVPLVGEKLKEHANGQALVGGSGQMVEPPAAGHPQAPLLGSTFKPIEHSGFILLSLQPPYQPGTSIGKTFVVDINGILRCQDHT